MSSGDYGRSTGSQLDEHTAKCKAAKVMFGSQIAWENPEELVDLVYLMVTRTDDKYESFAPSWMVTSDFHLRGLQFSPGMAYGYDGEPRYVALVMVRINCREDYPLAQMTVMDVCDRNEPLESGTPGIVAAPDLEGMNRVVQRWVCEQYGYVSEPKEEDLCDTVECKMDITYDLGGEG